MKLDKEFTKERLVLKLQIFNDITQVNLPTLESGEVYIYVLENTPQGNIKIGKSTNIVQRLKSLSGSNGGGNHISKIAVSKSTYLYSLEGTAHSHFHVYRIPGTEWFDGTKMTFEDAVFYIDTLFDLPSYERNNGTRKLAMEQKMKKEKLEIA